MSKLPSMPFFPADFFADTEHLLPSARHAYAFLLLHSWLRGAKLPNDDAVLARLAGFRMSTWRRLKPSVMEFWQCGDDGFLRNQRQHQNFTMMRTIREINKSNGARGGRPKSLFSKGTIKANGYISPKTLELELELIRKKEERSAHAREAKLTPETEKRERMLSHWRKVWGMTDEQCEEKWKAIYG